MGKKTLRKTANWGGIAAAPFTGGASLAVTGASALAGRHADDKKKNKQARAEEVARQEALEQKRIAKEEDIARRNKQRRGLSDLMSIE